ncbi:Voltage-gated hydrogen channel 1 [Mactra antiquata]
MDFRYPRRTKSEGLVTNALGFVQSYSATQLHKTEEVLEAELRRESCYPSPDKKVARLRLKGEHMLHSKHVLLAVVVLNLIDCVLVLGELILDIHFIRELRTEADMTSQHFINTLQGKYPDHLYGYDIENLNLLYEKLYEANCSWNNPTSSAYQTKVELGHFHGNNQTHFRRRRQYTDSARGNNSINYSTIVTKGNNSINIDDSPPLHHHGHSIWEHVAHGMHKASITILGILFVENIIKVICMGRGFFIKKLEVFDCFVVIVSFIVDLILLKGLSEYNVQDAVFVLTFLLPWRVIRVVNSLIVAVLDQEHFRLKMLYQEKKVVVAELKILKDKEKRWDFHLQKIEKFCESEGIPKWKIRQHTAMGRKQSTITSMASLALNGFLQGMVLSPSDKALFDRSFSQNSDVPYNNDHTHLDIISESEDSDAGDAANEEDATIKDRRTSSVVRFRDDIINNTCSDENLIKTEATPFDSPMGIMNRKCLCMVCIKRGAN